MNPSVEDENGLNVEEVPMLNQTSTLLEKIIQIWSSLSICPTCRVGWHTNEQRPELEVMIAQNDDDVIFNSFFLNWYEIDKAH